ncbi:uncharacterized protein LOC135171057 [Diachasmimorpha longicaudata]|uniref:uncharacterized protein LOC135171057 n=1 Tax=Diachasmimorpha longicaudata TaxID=58733 RepID=UPI0030B8D38C
MSVVHSPKKNKDQDNTPTTTASSTSSTLQSALAPPPPPRSPRISGRVVRKNLFQQLESRERKGTIMPATADALKSKRRYFKARLTKMNNWLKGEGIQTAVTEILEMKLADLLIKFSEWEAEHSQLLLLDMDHEEKYIDGGDAIMETYFKIAGELQNLINQRSQSPSSVRQMNSQQPDEHFHSTSAKLPEITLSTFDGSFEKYRSFHDEFKAVIHDNKRLQKVTKFQYFKSCLTREAQDLIKDLDITDENYDIAPLDSLASKEEQYNAFLITIILDLVNDEVVYEWEKDLLGHKMPDVDDLLEFLQGRGLCVKSTEAARTVRVKDSSDRSDPKGKFKKKKVQSSIVHSMNVPTTQRAHSTPVTQVFHACVQQKCPVCQGDHRIYRCPKFQEMEQQQRLKFVYNNNRCINCLAKGHGVSACESGKCSICERKHHPLLHRYEEDVTPKPSTSGDDILPTAIINILDNSRQIVQCRMLLDTGSSSNFITTELAEKLQLPRVECSVSVGALNDLSTVANYCVTATIRSRFNDFERTLDFLAIPAISSFIPAQQIDRKSFQLPHNIRHCLADAEFHKPSSIQLLLSSGQSLSTLTVGQRKIPNTANLIAQNTVLGWTICGSVNDNGISRTRCNVSNIIDEFKRFWEIEDGISHPKHLSSVEGPCEKHFIENVSRTPSGRYMVALPFNDLKDQLGSSRAQALRRFLSLERRLKANPKLWLEYSKVIEEYKQLGHMKKVENEIEEGFYLPHHAVVKMSSMTTKVRVVFDGSAKSSNKCSLNDALMVGPTIQDDIFSLILRFRVPKFVFTGDIEKMYRQVLIRLEDRKFQRIIWRDLPTDKDINVYELQTVTFGLAPAPYLATRCLHQLADDEHGNSPLASQLLKRDLYVDDVLTGADSLEETIKLRDELMDLLHRGRFNLRQCASNHPMVLQGLPDCAVNLNLLGEDDPKLKTLGVHWDSHQDCIVYTVNPIATKDVITMRTIASDVARIFDPLGLLNPVITHAKIIQQELWRLKLDWDDSIPQEICTKWNDFAAQLPLLNDLHFQRHIVIPNSQYIELHGFADASEKAYGACIYLRTVDPLGKGNTHLWCAKSRITPLKSSQTIPRLELCAAELLTNLYTTVKKATDIKPARQFFWTDSMITLQWIHKSPHTLETFIANRVTKIQQRTHLQDWRHIRTYDNPADAVSKGELPVDFLQNSLWKHGPKCLTGGEDTWPFTLIQTSSEVPGIKRSTCLITSTRTRSASSASPRSTVPDNPLFLKFSSFNKLKRFVGLALRWPLIHKTRQAVSPQRHPEVKTTHRCITVSEIQGASKIILLLTQQTAFSQEFQDLQNGRFVASNSKLHNLNPFIDDDGLIRVGGRLEKAKTISFDERHPIVLPPFFHVSRLIMESTHLDNLHTGTQTTLHLLRRQYWPIDGRRQIRNFINKCITCARFRPRPVNYLMGDLPPQRVTQSKPFEHTGVDYCGPLFIKEKRFRNRGKVKVWIAIFVCFTTKAVHIEVVDDLSTDEFLAALSRFISRHPSCNSMYSDHGTNFVGAKNELQELYALVEAEDHKERVQRQMAQHGIQWSFIPPQAPHCGGLWEAAVKSFKHHLRRTIGNELLTHQQLNTLCIKIEGILNSRPLIPLSSDPNDLAALTPAHFLHGSSTRDLPSPEFLHTPSNRLSYWEHIEKLKQEFWSRWHNEYPNELQIRHKWNDGNHKIKEVSLVLLRDDNIPPLQ